MATTTIDVSNLRNCVQDVMNVTHAPIDPIPDQYQALLAKLRSDEVRDSLPEVYRRAALTPFIDFLENLGEANFNYIRNTSESELRQRGQHGAAFYKQIMPDISLAIIQNADGFKEKASDAFQELVSDLYDSYLSDADRRNVKQPDKGVIPPLVKWGNPSFGPYTWTISATESLGLKCAIVSLPQGEASGGLLGWSSLGHETSGHDILHADTGLLDELAQSVYDAVYTKWNSVAFAQYWKDCTGEAASDVLGLLNMGPAAGIGLVGYFRGLNGGRLRTSGVLQGPHPVDVLRGYMAAQIVSQLSFNLSDAWAQIIISETAKDLGNRDITLINGETRTRYTLPSSIAIESAKLVGRTLSLTKMRSLENHSLAEIQDWKDLDQILADHLGGCMHSGDEPLPLMFEGNNTYGTHVVAGAVTEALKQGRNIQNIFKIMKEYLVEMHKENKVWEGYVNLYGQPVSMHRVHNMDPTPLKGGAVMPLIMMVPPPYNQNWS